MEKDLVPPYYAVIFTSQRTMNTDGYAKTDTHMLNLAQHQSGFLGTESARNVAQLGIAVSYWKDLESIQSWKENLDHQEAQRLGREKWYQWYKVEISRIERVYHFDKNTF